MSLFTKREGSLIFSGLKKSSFLKSLLLPNFLIWWSWNILYLFNILMMLNKWIIRWFWVDVTSKAWNLYGRFYTQYPPPRNSLSPYNFLHLCLVCTPAGDNNAEHSFKIVVLLDLPSQGQCLQQVARRCRNNLKIFLPMGSLIFCS